MHVLDHQYDKMLDTNKNESLIGGRAIKNMSMKPSEYFGAQRVDRLELHDASRERRCATRSASTRSCGVVTTRTTKARTPTRVKRSATPSTTPIRSRSRPCSAGTRAKVYGFDLDLLRRVAVEIEAPLVDEVRTPLSVDAIPADTSLKAFEEGPVRVW